MSITLVTTCHAYPWVLVRRGGQVLGQKPRTKIAYLTSTVAPAGTAIAVTGHLIIRGSLSKTARRIEWSDIVAWWRKQPTAKQVAAARSKQKARP